MAKLAEALPGLFDRRLWLSTVLTADGMLRRQDVVLLIRSVFDAVSAGAYQEAVGWIVLGLRCHPERTADEIRRQGVFRCSKYRFHTGPLRAVVSTLISHATELALTDEMVGYLKSVSALMQIGSSVRKLDTSLREFLVRRKDRSLKAVVALVDSLFMLDHQADHFLSSENWKHYTKEELAEAGSYIIHWFDAEIGMRDTHFNLMDEVGITAGLYNKCLVKACKVRKFLASEILVDSFDYRCSLRGHAAVVSARNTDLDISIRLGFIQNEQASSGLRIARIDAINQGRPSLYKFADMFYDEQGDRLIRLVEEPIKRYTFAFPDVAPFRAFFNFDGFLVEEELYLHEILNAELVTFEELKTFELANGISVFDLLKIFRIFGFVSHVAKRHLVTLLEKDPALAYRSLVPVFPFGQLEQMLEWCLAKKKVGIAIGMLSWSSGASETVDLQYRPILRGERHYMVPLNTAGAVNWYRNLAYTQRKRVIDVAEEEAASRALAATLSQVSGHVRKGFETVLKGKRIEIDILARFGNYLFVFECKHSLLPCSPHEMRTSYDHMKKAASQLTVITDLLAQKDIEVELYRRLGWNLPPASDIITCIVSCNGMFPGLIIGGHPIRRWHELRNIVESGLVRVGPVHFTGNDDEIGVEVDGLVERSLWEGPELTPDFLRNYVKAGLLSDTLYHAMVNVEVAYEIDNRKLVFSTFLLDALAAQQNIEKLIGDRSIPPRNVDDRVTIG